MTLVVNVLHKDFSLIASDRLANATGPTTMSIGSVTITLVNGGKIDGVSKLLTTANGCAAVGSAGNTREHTFADAFRSATDHAQVLEALRSAAYNQFDFSERDQLIEGKEQMVNESVVSFFDNEKSAFWTFVISHTRFESAQSAYVRKLNPVAYIFSVGSGHSTLVDKLPAEEVDKFTSKIAEEWSEPQLALWLDGIFAAVSSVNDTVGSSYHALIATRDNPTFRPVTREL